MSEPYSAAIPKRTALPWFYGWNVVGVGLVFLFFTLSAVGSPIAGGIRDVTGSYDLFFKLCLGGIVAGMIALLWLKPPPSRLPGPEAPSD